MKERRCHWKRQDGAVPPFEFFTLSALIHSLFSFVRWYKVNRGCRWVVETCIYVASIPFSFEENHDSLTESRYPLRVISPPRWKRNDSSRCSSHKLAIGRREVNRRSNPLPRCSEFSWVLSTEAEGARWWWLHGVVRIPFMFIGELRSRNLNGTIAVRQITIERLAALKDARKFCNKTKEGRMLYVCFFFQTHVHDYKEFK